MSVIYDIIDSDSNDFIRYIDGAPDTNFYPSSNFNNVFGPIFLPRVYGKDLTAFEIASSGKIAITLNDVHALDISRSNFTTATDYVTTINTRSNYALEISTSNKDVQVLLDAYSNDLRLKTLNNTSISASNNISINSKQNMNLLSDSGSLSLTGNGLTSIVSTTNDITLNSASNVVLTGGNGSVNITANTSNLSINLDKLTSNLSLLSTKDIALSASDIITVTASNDLTIRTIDQTLINTGKFNLNSDSNVVVSASNDFTVISKCNVSLTAENTNLSLSANSANMSLVMDKTASNITLYSSSNTSLITQSVLLLSSSNNTNIFSTNEYNTSVGKYSLVSLSNVSVLASNDFVATAQCNISLTALNTNFTLLGGKDVSVSTTHSNISLISGLNTSVTASNNLTLLAQSNISITASSNLTTYASHNINLSTNSSNSLLSLSPNTFTLYTQSNVSLNTSNNMFIYARSNVTLESSNLNIRSFDDTTFRTEDIFSVTSCNNIFLTACNILKLEANTIQYQSSSDMSFGAQSNISFNIAAATPSNEPIFQIDKDKVSVRGDLFITGEINTTTILSTTVTQNNLAIEDRTLTLSYVDGSNPIDGLATNDGAGIVIDGVPASVASCNELWPIHEKSISWNYGVNGTEHLGTSNMTSESYWEIAGGSLRMTHKKLYSGDSNIRELSFGFRINNHEELELVKKYWIPTASNYAFRRVARFGRVL